MANEDSLRRAMVANEQNALPILLLLAGDKYDAGDLFQGVANGNTKKVVLENTSSDKALLTFEPTVKSSGQVYAHKTKNPAIDTAGDAVTVTNPKTDASASPPANATSAGDNETGAVSGGTNYPQITAGSGSNTANAAPGESGTAGITDVIMPADTLSVSASNQSGSTQDISIVVSFLVIDTAEFDALRF